jgi:hypothetical protein
MSESHKLAYANGRVPGMLGKPSWNKGLTKADPRVLKNILAMAKTNRTGITYKRTDVTYLALHKRLYRKLGKAIKCAQADETCSKTFEWSNISHEYKDDLNDWQQLCASHHRRHDAIPPQP